MSFGRISVIAQPPFDRWFIALRSDGTKIKKLLSQNVGCTNYCITTAMSVSTKAIHFVPHTM